MSVHRGILAIRNGNRIGATQTTAVSRLDREGRFRRTGANGHDGLDKPDRPPEPLALVRVLPGAPTDRSTGEHLTVTADVSCPLAGVRYSPLPALPGHHWGSNGSLSSNLNR